VAALWRDKTRPSAAEPEVAEGVVALTLAGPPSTASHCPAIWEQLRFGATDLAAHGLRPHLVRRFKLWNDPQSAARFKEIVGPLRQSA
jgi:hypothetical protein